MNRNPNARKALGRVLRSWREEKGVSQEKFAHLADFDRTYVGAVERGTKNLSFEGLWQFLRALDRTWTDLGRALDREPVLRAKPVTRPKHHPE